MFIGGTLIKRFDGFRRLCRQAAGELGHSLSVPEADQVQVNRILAALGGPPAKPEVYGSFDGDGHALLLLFLLTQELPCRIGLLTRTEEILARLKRLIHLLGHGVVPLLSGQESLSFQEVVKEFGPVGAVLRPLIRYDQEGEPVEVLLSGGAGLLRTSSEGGPYTLLFLGRAGSGPAPLGSTGGGLHPTVLIMK